METFEYPIKIADLDLVHSRRIEATVNSGVFFTIAPSILLQELTIEPTGTRPCQMADGSTREMAIGNACVTIDGGSVFTVVAFGDDNGPLLLGKYTLIGLALAADPVGRRLVSLEPLPLLRPPPITLRPQASEASHDRHPRLARLRDLSTSGR